MTFSMVHPWILTPTTSLASVAGRGKSLAIPVEPVYFAFLVNEFGNSYVFYHHGPRTLSSANFILSPTQNHLTNPKQLKTPYAILLVVFESSVSK